MVSLGPVPKYMGYGGEWLLERISDVSLWYGISDKRRSRIEAAVESEVKDRLVAELTPVIREQAEQEVYVKAREDVREEADRAAPDSKQRAAFREFVKEVEVDCHAQAAVASAEADRAERQLRSSRMWRNPLAYLLLLALGPTAYVSWASHGFSPASAAAVLTMALTLIVLAATNDSRHGSLSKRFQEKRKVASDYLIVAERARAYRMVHAERLDTRKELDRLAGSLQDEKARLDRDHWPRVEDLHEARESARHRVEEQKYRVFDDFDERLEEAEAEARETVPEPRRRA